MEFDEEPPAGEPDRRAIPASRSITLEITPPKEGESEIWNCYSVTPLQVTVDVKEKIFTFGKRETTMAGFYNTLSGTCSCFIAVSNIAKRCLIIL